MFDFNNPQAAQNGFVYFDGGNDTVFNRFLNNDTGGTERLLGKAYGSNFQLAADVDECNQTANPNIACNPNSPTLLPNQGWDLTLWQGNLLTKWGWNGAVTGNGLNSLGKALGQSNQVYQFMTQRVVNEICPLGNFDSAKVNTIAAQAMVQEAAAQNAKTQTPPAAGSYGYIVVQVASDPSCI